MEIYKCTKCGAILTEFDVNFAKNLKGKFEEKNCKCANCLGNTNLLKKLRDNKPKIINYIFPYISILFFLILGFSGMWVPEEVDLVDFLYIILPCSFAAIIGYCVCVGYCVKDYNIEDNSYEYKVLETTYNESSDSFTTQTKTAYGGDNGFGKAFLLFITFPIWGLIRYIYLVVKFKKMLNNNFTTETIAAYDKTVASTETFGVSRYMVDKYIANSRKYTDEKERVTKKYSYLGEEKVKSKIKELKKPKVEVRSNKKSYDLIYILRDKKFVKDASKHYKILANNYAIYITDKKELCNLFKLVNEYIESDDYLIYEKINEFFL